MTRGRFFRDELLVTCEHAGNRVPRAYEHLFRGAETVLASHRGWDPGALSLARLFSRELDRPLFAVSWSRLFVEANRSRNNPRIWSSYMRALPRAERERILARWWLPHRTAVERAVCDAIARGGRVVHVGVHSFTPVLDGRVRDADVTLLYDSRRAREARLCHDWAAVLHGLDPALRLRFNYPYLGTADGLTTWLRRCHPEARYLGVELEINQARVGIPGWRGLQHRLATSLGEVLPER